MRSLHTYPTLATALATFARAARSAVAQQAPGCCNTPAVVPTRSSCCLQSQVDVIPHQCCQDVRQCSPCLLLTAVCKLHMQPEVAAGARAAAQAAGLLPAAKRQRAAVLRKRSASHAPGTQQVLLQHQ